MALDARDLRGSDGKLEAEVALSQEAREAREAGRELDMGGGSGAVADLIADLQDSLDAQAQQAQIVEAKLDSALVQLEELAEQVRGIAGGGIAHRERQATVSGAVKAQRKAEAAAIEGIRAVSSQAQAAIDQARERSIGHIASLEQESRRRIERLAMLTLSSKLFHALRWAALVLALFILAHAAWQMLL